MTSIVRWTGIALLSVLTGACAARPVVNSPVAATSPAPAPREQTEPKDREGAGEMAKEPARPQPAPREEPRTQSSDIPPAVEVTFRPILFVSNSAQLDPVARREVERLAWVLNDPRVERRNVTLEGHTDSYGSEAYNVELSLRRAMAVADELIARGIRRDRIAVEAYGAKRPVAPNTHPDGTDDPAGRALNRRVEAVIQNAP